MMANAQNAVVSAKDKETNAKDEVVATYYLPKTVYEIEVEAVNNKFKAGPYAADARRLFGTQAELQDRDAWEVASIRIKRLTEPDNSQQYKVFATYGTAGSLVSMTQDGILRGVNLPLGFDNGGIADNVVADVKIASAKEGNAFKTNFKFKDNDSVPDKTDAQFAYELINGLRSVKADVLQQNGDEVKDMDAYMNKVESEEGELYALFYGKTCREVVRKTFLFAPDKEMNNQEVCKFSARNGFNESGDNISISIKKRSATSKVTNMTGKTGFVYRVPAMADVEIRCEKNVVWKGAMEIPQLGRTECLPAGFFDKGDLKALFDTETGALKQIAK